MKNPAEIAHGPMLVGFTFNIFLFGMMTTQIYLYYTNFRRDRLWMKLFIFFIFILDTLNSVCDCIYLYDSLILHFGDTEFIGTANWVFATDPVLTGVIASLVQLFFAWRVFVLTRNWILGSVVVVGSLVGGVSSIITTWQVIKIPRFTNFQDFRVVVIIWLVSSAACDVLITSIMVWYLVSIFSLLAVAYSQLYQRKHKTGFKTSDLMIDRIIRVTVQTGLITSVVAVVDLIVYLTDPTGTHLIFNFPLCKLYTNSLMSSLNSRKGWKYSTSSERSERPVDHEKSLSGPGISSHAQDEIESRNSDWLSKRVSTSLAQSLNTSASKKLSAGLFNVRSKQNTSPEVYVHVESHELRDVSQQDQPSSYSDLDDTLKLKSGPLGGIQEADSTPVKNEKRTIVIPANDFSGNKHGRAREKEFGTYIEK